MVTYSKKVQSRLALHHGVRALYIDFTNDAEETFCNALSILQVPLNFLSDLFLVKKISWRYYHAVREKPCL